MTNYFFISSPLHFIVATNLALTKSNETNIAVFISKNKKTAQQYGNAARKFNTIFQHTFDLALCDDNQKVSKRKHCFTQINQMVSLFPPDNIYTGNDRRVEFQYAMHQAQTVNINVKGIYIDDGAISYLGHKSINNFAHRFVDPLLKKIIYGPWWNNPLTTGSSAWISSAYLAFPQYAHPLLTEKTLKPLDYKIFSSAQFLQVNDFLIAQDNHQLTGDFSDIKAVLCLPYESLYLNDTSFIKKIQAYLFAQYSPSQIAIKAHPRSKNLALVDDIFQGCQTLPNTLGMEVLLPKLAAETCIYGDISTTLLTARWLKPNLVVQAFELNENSPIKLKELFHRLNISFISL